MMLKIFNEEWGAEALPYGKLGQMDRLAHCAEHEQLSEPWCTISAGADAQIVLVLNRQSRSNVLHRSQDSIVR